MGDRRNPMQIQVSMTFTFHLTANLQEWAMLLTHVWYQRLQGVHQDVQQPMKKIALPNSKAIRNSVTRMRRIPKGGQKEKKKPNEGQRRFSTGRITGGREGTARFNAEL